MTTWRVFLIGLLAGHAVKAWDKFYPSVKTGLDVLVEGNYSQVSGKKILILTNPTGVTADLELGVDVMAQAGVGLVGVAGPEHGFRGTAQAGGGTSTFVDPETGLTVYDAYNVNSTTLVSYIQESGADTVIFDIQDVGARFYTYTWAMYDTFVASAIANTTFIVLDRPNPITGLNAHGPILNETYASYVGRRPIAQAHGMTTGELATMFKGEGWIKADAQKFAGNGTTIGDIKLQVVKMEGWERWMSWGETGLPWVTPSPNLQNPIEATLYPGTCLFEGTNFSEGRGTVRPFEYLGAGFGNSSWSAAMRTLAIPYTTFRPVCFAPTTSKWNSQTACGLQTYLTFCTDSRCSNPQPESPYASFDPVHLGVALLVNARKLYSNISSSGNTTQEFGWLPWGGDKSKFDVDILAGGPLVREGIEAGLDADEVRALWTPALEAWKSDVRAKYLLY